MKTPLQVQTYLRANSPEALKTELGIDYTRHKKYPNLVLFKYSMIDSPASHPIVVECRGLILDEANNWDVVSYSFQRFFNESEGHADKIDWEGEVTVQEKVDGSLMVLYRYNGEWHVQSSGSPDASGEVRSSQAASVCADPRGGEEWAPQSFADLFWKTFRDMGLELPPSEDLCYCFELTSPYNRVVVPHDTRKLTLIGVRDRITGTEYPSSMFAFQFPAVREYNLKSLDEVITTFKALSPLTQEGYVIRGARKANGSYARIKVKHPGYVAIHHMRDTLCDRAMLEVIRTGESSEFLTYFPEYTAPFNAIKDRLESLTFSLELAYADAVAKVEEMNKVVALNPGRQQKEFAQVATKTKCSAALFSFRSGKNKSIAEYLSTMNIKHLEEII